MSIKNPKISIGLPVFNGERFIQKKIESICVDIPNFDLEISEISAALRLLADKIEKENV